MGRASLADAREEHLDHQGLLRVGGPAREAARRPIAGDPAAEEARGRADDLLRGSGARDLRPERSPRRTRAPPAAEGRDPQGRPPGRPVPALRPRPEAPDDLHEGRQGADGPDRRPSLLERARAPHPRLAGPAERVPALPRAHDPALGLAGAQEEEASAGSDRARPVSRSADGRPRPPQLVVSLPRARAWSRRARPRARGCTRPGTPPASASSTRRTAT
jgi:hypothetical protein